uniref:Serine/threonine-protein phosphatase 2A activator n=1 Tax=Araucaria cunninghamii TaxID=56994 RepID=A0A0D6QUK5_ARACU
MAENKSTTSPVQTAYKEQEPTPIKAPKTEEETTTPSPPAEGAEDNEKFSPARSNSSDPALKPSEESPASKSLPPADQCTCPCGAPAVNHRVQSLGFSPPANYRPIRAPALLTPPNTQAVIAAPVPQATKVPLLSPPYDFQVPSKKISTTDDVERFNSSDAGKIFLGFVVALSESIRGRKISDYCTESPAVKAVLGILDEMETWVAAIPPVQQPARYGNPAFRIWQERLQQEGPELMLRVLPLEIQEARLEIFPYFADSFGNASRIDYGTGHETNFAAWLFCLARLGVVKEIDYHAVVSRVFMKYLGLMRKLQSTYLLEPAGSHGVWGLDDYHFLPFVFGSSQLVDHKYMKPKSIHNQDILDNFSNDYVYLACVDFVKKTKKGFLADHSPMIDDISAVPSWAKVNSGMLKMYKAEVLEKVPIMQHFLFGSVIKWE